MGSVYSPQKYQRKVRLETYSEFADRELEAYASFREIYTEKNPEPEKPSAVSALRDPEMYLLMLVAIASVLLTSLRTAEQFFRSAANSRLGEWMGWTEAALAIVAIEGSMVVYSMIRAKHNKATHDGKIYIFGIAVLGVISIIAALGQSITLMDNPPQWMTDYLQWGLTFVIGPGGALAALIGGHLLGSRLSDLTLMNEEGGDEFKQERQEWIDALNRSWNANKKKLIGEFQVEQPVTQYAPPVPDGRSWGYGELRGAIEDWYSTNHLSFDDSVDYQQIADEIGHHSSETVRVTISKMRNK